MAGIMSLSGSIAPAAVQSPEEFARIHQSSRPMPLRFATFTLDIERRQLMRDRQDVHLSPKAFDLLCFLVDKRPVVVSKTDLYERIWPGTHVVDANLTVLIAELRRALGDDPQAPQFIRTVPRFGYAFCADAVAISDPVSAGTSEAGGRPRIAPATRVGLDWNDRVLFLAEGENLIGRDPACGIWLDQRGVSRLHARIVLNGNDATIEDLDSKNGTFVGNSAVKAPRRIVDGDVIHIGPVTLRFRIWADGGVETERIARPRG